MISLYSGVNAAYNLDFVPLLIPSSEPLDVVQAKICILFIILLWNAGSVEKSERSYCNNIVILIQLLHSSGATTLFIV